MMKPLYYLKIARSIDKNSCPIPAKSLKWITMIPKVAWEELDSCNRERMEIQYIIDRYVIKVARAGWMKNIFIRLSNWLTDEWVVFKD